MAVPLARRCYACVCTGFTPHPSAPSVCIICSHESAYHEGASHVPSPVAGYGTASSLQSFPASPYAQTQPPVSSLGYSGYGSLQPAPPATAGAGGSRLCAFPGCTKAPHVELNGRTHPYCGLTHAQQHAQLYGGAAAYGPAHGQLPPATAPVMQGYPPTQPAYPTGQGSVYAPGGPAPAAAAYPPTGYPGQTQGYY